MSIASFPLFPIITPLFRSYSFLLRWYTNRDLPIHLFFFSHISVMVRQNVNTGAQILTPRPPLLDAFNVLKYMRLAETAIQERGSRTDEELLCSFCSAPSLSWIRLCGPGEGARG